MLACAAKITQADKAAIAALVTAVDADPTGVIVLQELLK